MSPSDLNFVPYRQARATVRNGDLLLFRRRGLISILPSTSAVAWSFAAHEEP